MHLSKESLDVLQTVHEGTGTIRISKLQILTTHFEELRMQEDDNIAAISSKLRDIADKALIGQKVLRRETCAENSINEEVKDVTKMTLHDLL